jgi:hypothetical protein
LKRLAREALLQTVPAELAGAHINLKRAEAR